jgi:formylglycine-generating enzyme
MRGPRSLYSLGLVSIFTSCVIAEFNAGGAAPVVSNVRASQRPGSKLVDIYYDLSDSDTSTLTVSIQVSWDAGSTWTVPAYTFTGAYGGGVSPGVNKYVVWNAGVDWDGQFTSQCRVRVTANDADPDGFVQIPAGAYLRGDCLNEGNANERPTNSVYISAFYIEKTKVTKARWDAAYQYGVNHGYASFDHAGSGKAADHPVQTVNWFDVVKWCNARSELEGRTPVYYTDAGLTAIYKNGQAAPFVKWSANGYRLPTEAEWEKAARGGLSGCRFPWGFTITHNQANYWSSTNFFYDTSLTRGYHPTYAVGGMPYTSPVASFAANGYGLFDMAGNVMEWCWDWYDDYWYSKPGATQSDTPGPTSGTYRVMRGGDWTDAANAARCAIRICDAPGVTWNSYGFRCVRGN